MFICVACALVCAAFLDGGSAAAPAASRSFGPWALDAFYFGLCHTKHTGFRTRKVLNLPEILIPPNEKNYTLYIPDLCKPEGWNQTGVAVTVCDPNAKPKVTLKSGAEVSVQHRHPKGQEPIIAPTCYIKEYCN